MNIRKQTGTTNTTYCPGRQILYLAVHYTAGVSCRAGSASGCAAWFANPASDGSPDYIVDEAELVQYNPDPLNRYCHAVGGARYNTQGGRLLGVAKNSNCISLEICSGNTKGKITVPNDQAYYFTDAVLAKAKEAVQYVDEICDIIRRYGLDRYDRECDGSGSGADPVVVKEPEVSAAAVETVMEPVKSAAGKKQYVVQAGAFAFKGNARKRLREVRKLGGAFKKAFMVKTGELCGADRSV